MAGFAPVPAESKQSEAVAAAGVAAAAAAAAPAAEEELQGLEGEGRQVAGPGVLPHVDDVHRFFVQTPAVC